MSRCEVSRGPWGKWRRPRTHRGFYGFTQAMLESFTNRPSGFLRMRARQRRLLTRTGTGVLSISFRMTKTRLLRTARRRLPEQRPTHAAIAVCPARPGWQAGYGSFRPGPDIGSARMSPILFVFHTITLQIHFYKRLHLLGAMPVLFRCGQRIAFRHQEGSARS